MEKYHRTDVSPIEKENERDETYEADNPQIDRKRTKRNYNLVKRDCSYTEYISRRLEEEKIKPRKDAVLMCSFVIGSEGAFFQDLTFAEERDFFRDATMYFVNKYGEENIISAVVHKDETTPHLHLNLIPLADGSLSAKKMFCPSALRELQTNLHKELGEKFGLERGKEGSQRKHLSTVEFKAKTILDNAESKAKEIVDEAQSENESLTEQNAEARKELAETKQELVETQQELLDTKYLQTVAKKALGAEADYKARLEEAKKGEFAHNKKGLREQIISVTADNKRLEKELAISGKDNGNLFSEVKLLHGIEEKAEVAKNAMFAVRKFEPEAFARTFFRAPSVIGAFIDMFTAPITLSRDRLSEIEEEIRREKQKQQEKDARERQANRFKSNWDKGD